MNPQSAFTSLRRDKPILGLTMGDPAGIGPEICLRALREPGVRTICTPVLFGDVGVLELAAHKTHKSPGTHKTYAILREAEWKNASQITEPLVVDCAAVDEARIEPGKISAACGQAAFVYIKRAVQAALAGKIHGVVTAPIHKESLHLAGVKHPGHTEIFTALTGAKRSCMMLYSDKLTVSMATTHIGYRDVPEKLSAARVLDVIELTAEAMRRILRREPRLGVCGLNPHAGEHGLFGKGEEENVVTPAAQRAREQGIHVEGPLVPDAAFTLNVRKRFDAFVTLYHDQGHIPFKMLAFDTGVNVTLGLPIIRTSVDHGTAFDIAWRGRADPTSLFSAIRVAAELAQNKNHDLQSAIDARNGASRVNRKSKIENPK